MPAEQHRLRAAAFCKLAFVLRTDVYKPEEDEVQRVFKLHIKNEPGELIFTDGEKAGMPKRYQGRLLSPDNFYPFTDSAWENLNKIFIRMGKFEKTEGQPM
ncbi:hypothetical protein V6C31_13530 [Caldibacillus debilis]|uniref:hypothetical protein n=1 Tax=Caldibacillus debilis TaxID=301148 RepID=UPI002FDA6B77